jgi:hypothetical protein
VTPTGTDTATVYLDLNQWINLSKAKVGHRDGGRYAGLYELARELVASGSVKLVLSGQHYFEIGARIRSFRQRNDLALTMAELTRYATLASRDSRSS